MTAPNGSAEARLHRALTGSDDLGRYDDPVDGRLMVALDASFELLEQKGLLDQVPVIAGTAPGPYIPGGPTTLLADAIEQVTARFRHDDASRWRNQPEASQQLAANLALLAAAPGGGGGVPGPLPAGESQGTVLWQPKNDPNFERATGVIAAGYDKTQFESSDMEIHEGRVEIAIVNTPWGRAARYTIPGRTVRAEAMPPQHQLDDQKGVLYLGSWFALDSSFPRNPSKGWSVITQLHGNDTTSPRFSLQINHNEIRIGDNKTVAPVAANTRYDWVMKADLAKGLVSMWINDEKKLDSYHCDTSKLPIYGKQGFYHSSDDGGGTIFQGPLKIGTGYGAVRPRPRPVAA